MKNILLTACACIFVLAGICQDVPYAIIPQPAQIALGRGVFELNGETRILSAEACKPEAQYFAEWLREATGKNFIVEGNTDIPQQNFILFSAAHIYDADTPVQLPQLPGTMNKRAGLIPHEGYRIVADDRAIVISADYSTGVFYGIQTLRQMLPTAAESGQLHLPYQLTGVMIRDTPKFPHRALMLDCARHFMTTDLIKKYLDVLALYKMNVFHWHLTDDQGWRIEIKKYPLLTEVGAWRTEADGARYGGFYSQQEIREIVAYAASLHITVIPEIELPGHSSAAIAAYPDLGCSGEPISVENEWGVFKDIFCAGNERTFEFLEGVMTEVCELFPGQYIHIGGDEVPKYRWEQCEKCQRRMKNEHLADESELQSYFIGRVAGFLAEKNKKVIGWDEVMDGAVPGNLVIQSWRGLEGGEKAVKAGHQAIMSPTSHCYFDYDLGAIDLHKVYDFYPIPDGLDAYQQGLILGAECNMWTEHAPQEILDSKVFPRLLAMSEVLWTYPEQRNYNVFFKRVDEHFQRLSALGINYGFPAVPFSIVVDRAPDDLPGVAMVTFNKNMNDVLISYSVKEYGNDLDADRSLGNFDGTTPFTTSRPVEMNIGATFQGREYPVKVTRIIYPHKAFQQNVSISYEPSSSYTGGGTGALVDGCIGTENFRDGIWQAVQGKNMEAIIDLGDEVEIENISTNWFHYTNAWIFRPSHVAYYVSSDGKEWKMLDDLKAQIGEQVAGESIMTMSLDFPKSMARYIKMEAYNNGPCPAWHDAPGEPSWLFCDEIIVK